MVKIVVKGYEIYCTTGFEYTEIQNTALYILFLSVLEFVAMTKFCVNLEIEGAFQLIPLKFFRYISIFGSLINASIVQYRLLYLLIDMLLFYYFLQIKDTAFSQVFHKYNIRIGLDVNIRNAFIVSEKQLI